MLTAFAAGRTAREADLALRSACRVEDEARKCAVLWFGEILSRRLYRALGHSSMQKYARVELGFSETRIGDFMRLARRLDQLPALRAALPEIGYTKAREIVRVASPRNEARWVEAARSSTREQLAHQVKRVKARAKAGRVGATLFAAAAARAPDAAGARAAAAEETAAAADGAMASVAAIDATGASGGADVYAATDPGDADPALAADPPVRLTLEFTAEQHARWLALWERLRKRGVSGDRAEVMLAALHDALANSCDHEGNAKTAPRGAAASPFQVHVHRCPDCGRTTAGGRTLGRADAERVRCDAAVSEPSRPNRATIPPRVRREVMARDGHRCRAPGCGRMQFLEVHHVTPRSRGGGNEPANLLTLCAGCHRLWHEKGLPLVD